MFDHWLRLNKMRRFERQLKQKLHSTRAELRSRKASADEIEAETNGLILHLAELEEEWQYLDQETLLRKARHLWISLPPRVARNVLEDDKDDEYWEGLPLTNQWILKPKGLRQIRTEIREERKARRDYILGWISPFVGIISALVGAVVGYFLGSRH